MAGQQQDEADFQRWYQKWAELLGLDPDPDAPEHYYDYRAAFRAGAMPDTEGHWPSTFKREGHPNLVVDGIDTRTGNLAAKYFLKNPVVGGIDTQTGNVAADYFLKNAMLNEFQRAVKPERP
jgi:hypothetical protein